mgnify:CR=1 FL=1
MKAIDLLVNSVLPPDMQRDSFDLSAKGVKSLLSELAMTHKDEYADIIDKLKNIGRNLVYQQGATITLNDLKAPFDRQKVYDEMDDKVKLIKATVKDKKEQKKLIKQTYQEYSSLLDNLTKQFTSDSPNGLSRIVQSGARGNLTQQKAIVTSPSVYVDYKGDTIPIFVRKSFAEGLSLPEYLAGTYGGRAAVIEGKKNTAKFGGLGKELGAIGVQQVVTKIRDDSNNFIDLDADDISAYGRVLAKDTSGYPRGTLIDKNVLAKLRGAGNKTLYVYSPLSTVSEEGIPAEAVGISYNGTLPGMGYQAGITAAQSLGEILAQSSLNAKHFSGLSKGGAKKNISGGNYIEQFLQSPENFKDRATVAKVSGTIDEIKPAPQGGSYIYINGEKHYVLPDLSIDVKKGDKVERGDIISDGLADVEDVVKYRGLGSGRRYFARRLRQLFNDSGHYADLKNTEVLARGLINKVRVTDPNGIGNYLYGDIADYNAIAANYEPPKSAKDYDITKENIEDKYLEQPILHYTIGTKLTPRMINRMKKAGFTTVKASDIEPPFEPVVVRMREAPMKGSQDWLAKQKSSYLESNLIDSAIRGSDSNIRSNINAFVRMGQGVGFGEHVEETGKF